MMNKDTQNIYEAYVTESPDQIAKIDKRIARLQSKKARLQPTGAPTASSSPSTPTSSSTSTTTTGTASSSDSGGNDDRSQFQPAATPSTPDAAPTVATAPATPNTVSSDATGNTTPSDPPEDQLSVGDAFKKVDFNSWKYEQDRINQSETDMPNNWQNASWAKRARMMGRGRSPAQVKALAQKEWKRKEAQRRERELATHELNPDRQTGAQYFGNQLKKMPGNISAGLQGLGSAVFGKNKIPQTTAAGDAVRDADGKLQWKDNSTGKPGLVQRAGGAVKKAFTPSKPAAPAPAAPAPVQKNRFTRPPVNRRKSRVLNQSTNAFDAVLQDKNVDHLID